ncbi:cobalt-precorrin-6A reductase [Methylobacterium aerolatum]|uniref:Precorrin-6A/cobalt-precorrin-6A reductase n=1 Tax=Methylobacterium aerolatum TaxID=418708 RepID=A0ABU0HTV2_9HYPH|nr:cobalt-precorrin-6A reductase [Methylobacterium aerolatum]MDQ0445740.1 precorrin-6A/cobalt-precorrin-6A reductase [Methylobacterium aerolatum]GJD35999.1 Precorrin-6A reductase [Methylobacterium aerolatum]
MSEHGKRLLVLGGTTEATALASLLAREERFAVILSLAGRTRAPVAPPVPVRVGGFGGVDGLARFLTEERIDRLIDATHPFAARISANAAEAARRVGVSLLAIRRPAWVAEPGDRWTEVADMAAAAEALGERPRRVFLTIGRQEVAAFAAAPQHAYVVRSIEPIGDTLPVPRLRTIEARGPFDAEAEAALMREAGIETVVSKNAGGAATFGKILAARHLGLPVVMVRRPAKPEVPSVPDAAGALAWLRIGE